MTDYFDWLLQRIGCQGDGYRATYLIMNDIPFRYFVMDDENRMEDGLRLRDEYMYENNIDETVAMPVWPFDRHRASVFEVLVGIVLRMDDPDNEWLHSLDQEAHRLRRLQGTQVTTSYFPLSSSPARAAIQTANCLA